MPGYQDLPRDVFEKIVRCSFDNFKAPEEVVENLMSLVVPAGAREALNARDFVNRTIQEPQHHLVQRAPEGTPPGRASPDSDNSGINEPESRNDSLLQKVKPLYDKFARERVAELWLIPLQLEHVYECMNIDRIAPTEECKAILLPFNCLKVTIAHRRVIFEIWSGIQTDQRHEIRYSGTAGVGGTIRYGNKCVVTHNTKYQTLAAKDFLFLVQHPQMMFTTLTFYIMRHDNNPNQWPFTSFFGKIRRHLERLNRPINVLTFGMKFFENPIDPRTTEQGLIMKVLPFLNVNMLIFIKLRVLEGTPNVNLNSPELRNCAQWRSCQILDIVDWKIFINDFRQIAGFASAKMKWQQNAYRVLFEGLSNNILPDHEVTCHHPMIIRNRAAIEREIEQCRLAGILQENDVQLNLIRMCIIYLRLRN